MAEMGGEAPWKVAQAVSCRCNISCSWVYVIFLQQNYETYGFRVCLFAAFTCLHDAFIHFLGGKGEVKGRMNTSLES